MGNLNVSFAAFTDNDLGQGTGNCAQEELGLWREGRE